MYKSSSSATETAKAVAEWSGPGSFLSTSDVAIDKTSTSRPLDAKIQLRLVRTSCAGIVAVQHTSHLEQKWGRAEQIFRPEVLTATREISPQPLLAVSRRPERHR